MWLFILIWSAVAPASGSPCGDQKAQNQMAAHVFADRDYRQFVCGDGGCEMATFQERLDFRGEILRQDPVATGCYVEPRRKAINYYTGFFLISNGTVTPQLIFFGAGLGTTKDSTVKLGFKSVLGSERISPSDRIDHLFQWDGSSYVEVETPGASKR